MKKITVDDIMSVGPRDDCPRECVEELIGDGKTLLQILDLDIPFDDKLWVCVKFMDPKKIQLFTVECAEHALNHIDTPHHTAVSGLKLTRQCIDSWGKYGDMMQMHDKMWEYMHSCDDMDVIVYKAYYAVYCATAMVRTGGLYAHYYVSHTANIAGIVTNTHMDGDDIYRQNMIEEQRQIARLRELLS